MQYLVATVLLIAGCAKLPDGAALANDFVRITSVSLFFGSILSALLIGIEITCGVFLILVPEHKLSLHVALGLFILFTLFHLFVLLTGGEGCHCLGILQRYVPSTLTLAICVLGSVQCVRDITSKKKDILS
jgi:hypothetical protein